MQYGKWKYSCILAWKIPWTEEPGGPQLTGCRVRHDSATNTLIGKYVFSAMQIKSISIENHLLHFRFKKLHLTNKQKYTIFEFEKSGSGPIHYYDQRWESLLWNKYLTDHLIFMPYPAFIEAQMCNMPWAFFTWIIADFIPLFWLHWICVALCGRSLVAWAGATLLQCMVFSLGGFSHCGARRLQVWGLQQLQHIGSGVVAHGFECRLSSCGRWA